MTPHIIVINIEMTIKAHNKLNSFEIKVYYDDILVIWNIIANIIRYIQMNTETKKILSNK